ncbi:MAG: preprotein translocase subunit SecY [Limnochordaceae bacterium]|uniref:Protein translocase subunit SecY n=1 Tax=Carboxydichorda subterranea TaxID=3109565 RepID=A0ABZ1BYR6_9FIRM|nr:preprotein translocase subunit SecY [Limnochorda sp. L945t]MBE3599015.1 preprotein translocase subunit SecY [Limnochordaceae bacterium]WRP17733.1 preprotein translocase subunit SecY [Limnochorda sp. L945t]
MIEALRNAVRIEDLRNKLLYTVAMLAIFRVGSYIPVPGVDAAALAERFRTGETNIFSFLDLFAGGAFSNFSIFAMSVTPYITASIIVQLLTVVIPKLEEMAKEGVEGRKQLAQYTRYGTVLLAVIQAIGTVSLARAYNVLRDSSLFSMVLIVTTLTAGTVLLMWLGEKISENGIGNGISLIIFAGIVARLPSGAIGVIRAVGEGGISILSLIVFAILAVALIAAIVLMQEGQRRIPVQYAKRVVGRRMYGGQSTHIPMRVNQAGVIPIIFAASVLTFPLTIAQFIPAASVIDRFLGYGTTLYNSLYAILVIFFTYFYTAVTFNPRDVADNMKKYGGFIPGIRPGQPTAEYLDRVLTRITLVGALFLAFIAIVPYVLAGVTHIPRSFITIGGTGLLIVVGVALDTLKQIEAHLLMRQYEGFIR